MLSLDGQKSVTKSSLHSTIRAVAGQRSSPDLCLPLNLLKSMSHDIDLKVIQVGHNGTA